MIRGGWSGRMPSICIRTLPPPPLSPAFRSCVLLQSFDIGRKVGIWDVFEELFGILVFLCFQGGAEKR